MTARHYLQVLQREGQVGAPQTVRRAIPGRPSLAYQLTKAAAADFPKEFAALAGHLIEAISTTAGSADKVFFELVNRMSADAPCAAPTAVIETRLDQAATFLARKGYVADWEPTAAGPSLQLALVPAGASEYASRAVPNRSGFSDQSNRLRGQTGVPRNQRRYHLPLSDYAGRN